MKNAIAAAFLLLLSLPALAADYSGTWVLDQSASKDLPPRIASGLKEWRIDVKQTAEAMTVGVHIDRGNAPFDITNNYRLDGSAVTFESAVRTPDGDLNVPTTTTAKPAADGAIDITISTDFERNGMRMKRFLKEQWTLSEDGKTLSVACVDETPRGVMQYTLVFRRA